LGFFAPFGAWLLWISISISALLFAMRVCRKIYGAESPNNLFAVIGYTFAPIPACLVAGQMGLILLLGLALFLKSEKHRPVLAGAALILPFAKPHLLVLFWLALVVRGVFGREHRTLAGLSLAVVAAAAVAVGLDTHVFQHYRGMLQESGIAREFIPGLSGVVRLLFFRSMFWVQFFPITIALVWGALFLRRNWSAWDWRRHGPTLLVISVLTTPYSWITDEVVLLPAILQAAALVYQSRRNIGLGGRVALLVFALLNALLLLILRFKIPFATGIYFWSSLVWFGWYEFGMRLAQKSQAMDA
jgi:hypothetical protein